MYLNGAGSDPPPLDDDGVVHGVVRLEGRHRLCHRRALLADGDVDALHPQALLVEDGVDGAKFTVKWVFSCQVSEHMLYCVVLVFDPQVTAKKDCLSITTKLAKT